MLRASGGGRASGDSTASCRATSARRTHLSPFRRRAAPRASPHAAPRGRRGRAARALPRDRHCHRRPLNLQSRTGRGGRSRSRARSCRRAAPGAAVSGAAAAGALLRRRRQGGQRDGRRIANWLVRDVRIVAEADALEGGRAGAGGPAVGGGRHGVTLWLLLSRQLFGDELGLPAFCSPCSGAELLDPCARPTRTRYQALVGARARPGLLCRAVRAALPGAAARGSFPRRAAQVRSMAHSSGLHGAATAARRSGRRTGGVDAGPGGT